MPALFSSRQPMPAVAWFDTAAGRAVIASEADALREALVERPAQPWLWLAAAPSKETQDGRGVRLAASHGAWSGVLRCRWPLPLASEAMGTVVLQHVGELPLDRTALLEECARVLAPGGRLWLFALNPLTAYRRHWVRTEVVCVEPVTWRRRLRAAGLEPEPVSTGLGPRWKIAESMQPQPGAGLRAAYLLRARKRVAAPIPPTPVATLRWQPG